MADFCRQCSMDHFGEDFGDLRPTRKLPPGTSMFALCEGCGPIQVNQEGECICEDCHEKGHPAYQPRPVSPHKKV